MMIRTILPLSFYLLVHGWNHVETRRFLDHQFFAVFTPR
jgi:hypothetical protein